MRRLLEHLTLKAARKLIVLVIGTTVVLFGVVLIFIPGPAIVVIPTGLAILATEFVWARRLLRRVRQHVTDLHTAAFGNRRGKRSGEGTSSAGENDAAESGRTVRR